MMVLSTTEFVVFTVLLTLILIILIIINETKKNQQSYIAKSKIRIYFGHKDKWNQQKANIRLEVIT